MPEGSVYIVAEGETAHIDSFIEWVRQGPKLSRVDSIELTEGKLENFDGFEIRHT